MNVARKHHFVPDFYLRGFTHPVKKNLAVLDPRASKPFQQAPRNVAYELDFNTVDIPNQSPDVLEKAYAQFEGKAATSLRRIGEARFFCDDNDQIMLLNVIALLAARHPRRRETMGAASIHTARIISSMLVSDKKLFESQMRQAAEAGHVANPEAVSYEKMKDFIERNEYQIVAVRDALIQREFKMIQTVLERLVPRKWSIVRAPADCPFVTSDDPVALGFNDGSSGFVGFGMPNADVHFPISQSLLAIGSFQGLARVLDANVKQVAALNSITAAHARSQVYAPNLDFYYCREDGTLAQGAELLKEPFFKEICTPNT